MTPMERLLEAYNYLQEVRADMRAINAALGGLEGHELGLGSALKRGIQELEEQPAPPIEIEMLVREVGEKALCRGNWIAGPPWLLTHSSSLQEGARAHAEKWLAALSEKLGVKLVPKWEGEEPVGSADISRLEALAQI